jgi:oligogalacturonide lyase
MPTGAGTTHPREARELRDARTGARVRQLTAHDSLNHHLYPLTCSTTPDMSSIVFASNRSGDWQFYQTGFENGPILQITARPGSVHGYSGHLGAEGGTLLYTAGGEVRCVELESFADQPVARWEGASLGEVSLSADGEWLVTAMKWRGAHYLAVARSDGTESGLIFESERTIIHPQFHPLDDNIIEYAQDPAPRMWLIGRDGSGNRCLYAHDNDEFVVHETWLGDSDDLVFTHWPHAVRRLRLTGDHGAQPQVETIVEFNAWHIAPNRAGTRILCDTNHPDLGIQLLDVKNGERTTVCHPGASCRGSQWKRSRYALREDFERAGREAAALSWMEAKADTVYGPQWTHPHPSWSADERWCLYDSDASGTTQVYAVEVPQS